MKLRLFFNIQFNIRYAPSVRCQQAIGSSAISDGGWSKCACVDPQRRAAKGVKRTTISRQKAPWGNPPG